MATLTPGYVFGKTLSAAKLHQFIDDAYLVGVAQADLSAGLRLLNKSTPAAPIAGDVRVGSTGLLEFYNGATWLTQEADNVAITLTNGHSTQLLKGDVVVPKKTALNTFTIASVNRTPDVLGVLAENIAAGANGLVYLRGLVQANVQATTGFPLAAGTMLRGPDVSFSIDRAFCEVGNLKSDCFATLLEASGGALSWVRFGK